MNRTTFLVDGFNFSALALHLDSHQPGHTQEHRTYIAFPYKRKNSELAKLVSYHFLMRAQMYAKHEFPDPYHLPSGRSISKPATW